MQSSSRHRSSWLDEPDLTASSHNGRLNPLGVNAGDVPLSGSNNNKSSNAARRLYRTATNKSLSVTREIAALDFLVGIPLEAEGKIVRDGWIQERRLQNEERKTERGDDDNDDASDTGSSSLGAAPTSLQGKWWEKWIKASSVHDHSWSHPGDSSNRAAADRDNAELERPEAIDRGAKNAARTGSTTNSNKAASVWQSYAPGRRLEGDEAIRVQIPVTTKTLTKQRSIARQAALREWESQTTNGILASGVAPDGNDKTTYPIASGRLFFSAAGAYPVSVFSMIRYEPRKEEQQLRRQKLEALGGGGSQFVLPTRDWRGVSYRSLLPRQRQHVSSFFDRFRSEEIVVKNNNNASETDDDKSTSSASSDDSDEYHPDLLDDPEMKLGRHRNIIIGDRTSGPMVTSTIQFVKPDILKAELNKQFRERFDGWEPPRGARKYIGARVVNGEYKLMDPTMEFEEDLGSMRTGRKRQDASVTSSNSVASEKDTVATTAASTTKEMVIRMPPSLTLSKIRSLKHQALIAALKAKLEIGTVALACVYFERLCLDCRVDKSNRRLTFAVCMLLAAKLNEPNVGLTLKKEKLAPTDENEVMPAKLNYLIGPNERSNNMFESLLGFFTQDWNLSLKRIFDAEWGVFAALGFSLHARPSHVAFHFRRMMKTLEWNVRDYLGRDMHDQWQREIEVEEDRQRDREKRKERKRREREQRILNLRIEIENEVIRRKTEERKEEEMVAAGELSDAPVSPKAPPDEGRKKGVGRVKSGGMRLLSRMRRVTSSSKIVDPTSQSEHTGTRRRGSAHAALHLSPSLPALATMANETSAVAVASATTGAAHPAEEPDSIAIDIALAPSSTHDDGSLGSLTFEGDDGALHV